MASVNQITATATALTRRRERRLAVLGWRSGTPALVDALTEHARARTVAVGDTRAFALIRARGALQASCFQHVLEMVRTVDYELLLIGDDTYGAQAAEVAARRGATLLVDASRLSAATLEAAASTAQRYGVPFVLLQPGLPIEALEAVGTQLPPLVAATPQFTGVDIEADQPAVQSLRDAVASLLSLTSGTPLNVAAAGSGEPNDYDAINVQVRFEDGALASLTARLAEEPRIRLSLRAGEQRVEADIRKAVGSISFGQARPSRTSFLPASESAALEAARVRHAAEGSAQDVRAALAQAVLLAAIETALETGAVEHVAQPSSKTALRVLRGGGVTGTVTLAAERPRLRIVG